jgi:hypothetical protein
MRVSGILIMGVFCFSQLRVQFVIGQEV